jgi:signal transduction histidine kinase
MLYLKHIADEAGAPRRVPLSTDTSARLEVALLSREDAERRSELRAALANDSDVGGWALRLAEHRTGRTVNVVDEAAEWLSGRLALELDAAIESEGSAAALTDVLGRLPALVAKLADVERALAAFDERLECAKLESLKELAYGASHEINNPLANIAARAQTLLEDEADPERIRKLSAIHRQAMRAHEMISDLMLFARPPKLDRKPLDVRRVVRRVVDEYGERAAEREVELRCETGDEPLEVSADETQIGVAFAAVLQNALEAAPNGGWVHVAVRRRGGDANLMAEISVTDNGPGISDLVRQHLFDAFFSGREAGRGLGFGLSKCWRIVTDHGGRVVVNRPSPGGAEFCIVLPANFTTAD